MGKFTCAPSIKYDYICIVALPFWNLVAHVFCLTTESVHFVWVGEILNVLRTRHKKIDQANEDNLQHSLAFNCE